MGLKGKCIVGLAATGMLMTAAGCAESVRWPHAAVRPAGEAAGRAATRPAGVADEFSPLPAPPDFDRDRALLPLAQVPGDPPAPAAAGPVENAELPRQALQRIEEARRLFAEHRFTEAIQELKRALRYNANSHEAHQLTALAALLSDNEELARAAADRALAIRPNDLASHYVLARLNEKAGQLDDALREYRLALKSESADALAAYRALTNHHLGNLLFEQQYYTAAIEQLTAFEERLADLGEKAAEHPELATIARLRRGAAAIRAARAYGLLGDYARAAESLKIALAQAPQDSAVRAEYIRMLGRAGRTAEAAKEAERFVLDTKGSKDAVTLLMAAHRRAGNPDQALEAIRRLASAEPDNIELWHLYVQALSSAKRFDEAVAALNELVARHPEVTDTRWWLIQLTRERGDWARWLGALAQHLKNQPQDLARVREELARLPQETARQMLAEASRPDSQRRLLPVPDSSDDQAASALDVLLARVAEQAGQPEQALALSEQAVKRTPGFLPALIETAERHVAACRWKDTIAILEAGEKELKTPSARLESLLARAYDGLDEIDPAIEHYRKAIALDKKNVEPMLRLGRLYERIGRGSKEAVPVYQAAIAAQPDNMRTRELLVRLMLREAAQSGELAGRVHTEIRDMKRLAPQDPATVRMTALMGLVEQGEAGRKDYLDTLRTLIRNRPDDLQSREDLVGSLMAFHEYDKALVQARELSSRQTCSAEADELLASAHVRVLDFPAAAQQLDRALATYPKRESLLSLRSRVAMIVQDYDTAIQMDERLLELPYTATPKSRYRAAMVEAFREAGRYDQGRERVESWLAQGGKEAEIRQMRTFLLTLDAAAGDHEKYVARIREWLRQNPDDETMRVLLLGSETGALGPLGLIGAGRQDEAILLSLKWLHQGIEARTDGQAAMLHDLRLLGPLLTVLQAADRHAEAVEIARAQVAAGRNRQERAFAQQILRAVYIRARKVDEAVAITQTLLAQSRGESTGEGRLLVTLLMQAGRNEEAIARINRLLATIEEQKERIREFQKNNADPQHGPAIRQALEELDENRALLLRTLSSIYQHMDQRDVAEARLREAYQLDPGEIGINNDLGYLLADAGKNLDEAERMIRLALGQDPRVAAYQDSLAWALYKKGDLRGARTWLLRATAMEEGQDPVVYDHLGDVQWRLGDKEAAIESWRQAARIYQRQAQTGEIQAEKDVFDRVKAKLDAIGAGREPKVAPLAAESRPAE